MNFFPCPVCGQMAEVQDRLRRDPRGPITHATVACVAGDLLILSAEDAEGLSGGRAAKAS